MDNFAQDNIIEWIFDKAFNQLTSGGDELLTTPFSIIKAKTFYDASLYLLINDLSHRPYHLIEQYLTNITFQERFLFKKIKKKLYVQIILGNLDNIQNLIRFGYKLDYKCLQLISLNGYSEIMDYLFINHQIKLENELLMHCSEFGHEKMYFYLRERGLLPNISIYHTAVSGNSISIIKDISELIGITNDIIGNIFEANNTEIILFAINEAIDDNIKIQPNLVAYPILNNNIKVIEELEKLNMIDWHSELCYSAILSGSVSLLQYIESKIPGVHNDLSLDLSKERKGQVTVLLDDMMYIANNKKYFSHSMNYAIQSESLDMVIYIYSIGYQITVSNFITAIRQGTTEILKYLCKNYNNTLPFYIIHYFGMNSYISNKLLKVKILIDAELFKLEPMNKLKKIDYQTETAHIEIIQKTSQLSFNDKIDPDYLMKYELFFVPDKKIKLNYRLLTRLKLCLQLELDDELEKIFNSKYDPIDSQFVLDELILFGTIRQISKFCPLLYENIDKNILPNREIIMEVLCYRQIPKLVYLLNNNIISEKTHGMKSLIIIMGDYLLDSFSEKLEISELLPGQELKFILLSGNLDKFNAWLIKYPDYQQYLDKNLYKMVLSTENMNLIKMISVPNALLQELISWTEEKDLLEINYYLRQIKN